MAAIGIVYLVVNTNVLTALLALVALANYLFLYTPLKQRTTLCTAIGAVSGAIPPVMGWTAVQGSIDPAAWALFALLFLWQFPHFLAIAWMYREDYERAGFRMLPVIDPEGILTARQVGLYSLALVPVSLLPAVLGFTGTAYLAGALLLSLALLALGLGLFRDRSRLCARRVLLGSVIYLPALLMLMAVDRVPAG
jgi:protoheme IX farnesyltransferase